MEFRGAYVGIRVDRLFCASRKGLESLHTAYVFVSAQPKGASRLHPQGALLLLNPNAGSVYAEHLHERCWTPCIRDQ